MGHAVDNITGQSSAMMQQLAISKADVNVRSSVCIFAPQPRLEHEALSLSLSLTHTHILVYLLYVNIFYIRETVSCIISARAA